MTQYSWTGDSACIQTYATNTSNPHREAPPSRSRRVVPIITKMRHMQRTSTKRGSEPAAPPAPESSTSSHADTIDCGPAAMEGTGKETTVAEELMVGQNANGQEPRGIFAFPGASDDWARPQASPFFSFISFSPASRWQPTNQPPAITAVPAS